jgi:hypothetical protein
MISRKVNLGFLIVGLMLGAIGFSCVLAVGVLRLIAGDPVYLIMGLVALIVLAAFIVKIKPWRYG